MKILAGLVLFFGLAFVTTASPHSITLLFTASVDDLGSTGTGYGYTAWRASGTCPTTAPTTTAGFIALNATPFLTNTYTDSTVTVGQFCYIVTFTSGSASSLPSNTAGAAVLPAAPTNVKVGTIN
jgi:hypothetical protein